VLLLRGELTPGSHLIAGTVTCRIRSLTSSSGKIVKSVPPGTAVSVSGWKDLPNAGDEVLQASEEDIKRAVVNRKRNEEMLKLVGDVEAINARRREDRERRELELERAKEALKNGKNVDINGKGAVGVTKEEKEGDDEGKLLRLIVKADVYGSAEAVAGALEGIGNDRAKTKIVSYSVGNITEGDVTLAKAIGGGFLLFVNVIPRY
jgi:translation initiation factor IF-2